MSLQLWRAVAGSLMRVKRPTASRLPVAARGATMANRDT